MSELLLLFLIIGLSCFFTGCNLEVTSYCPLKHKEFHGHIYDKKIIKEVDEKSNGNQKEYYKVYLYGINTHTNETCKYFAAEYETKIESKKVYKTFSIDQPVHWYKKHDSDRCLSRINIIATWYAGIVFLGLSVITLFFFKDKQSHRVNKKPTSARTCDSDDNGDFQIISIHHDCDDDDDGGCDD